jgi:Zn finger protein HypA/HybF involved in hydrogenase expression
LKIEDIEKKFPGELVSGQKYRNNHQTLVWRCLAGLGHENYRQRVYSHNAGSSCPRCAVLARSLTIEELEKRFPDLVAGQKYKNSFQKLQWKCEQHGEYSQAVVNHYIGQRCPECGREITAAAHRLTVEEIEKRFPGELVPKQEYKTNTSQKIQWRCLKCGHLYWQSVASHLQGCRCPRCSESKGEKRIAALLGEGAFDRQKKFANCRNVRQLRFDFAVKGKPILIECHGIQHRFPVVIFGGQRTFHGRKKRDEVKRIWARRNGYRLIEVPYYQGKDLEGFLIRRLAQISPDYCYLNRRTRLASAVDSKEMDSAPRS